MKLASCLLSGRPSYGAVVDGGSIKLGARLGDRYQPLRAALVANAPADLAQAAQRRKPDIALADVTFAPPIPDAGKISCIGRNYKAHVAEARGELPSFPSVFAGFGSSIVGHDCPIQLSPLSSDFDFEGELALVIGTPGRHITREHALTHVAGYACLNAACYRDFQFKHSLTAGKKFAQSGSSGPWMATADKIPDPRPRVTSFGTQGR